MRKLILVGAALVVLCSAGTARAVVLLSDSFNYTNGPLVTVSGTNWTHHSGATTGELQVIAGEAFLTQTNFEDVAALLAGQPYGATTNLRLYASFTVNFSAFPSGAGTYFVHFKDSRISGFRDKIFATTNGVPAGFFRVGVANVANSPNATIGSNLSLNTDYTLVTRYAPSNATSVLWLNPSAESDPSASATDAAGTISVTTFALRESLSGSDGMGSLYLDNLIVGTSFGDVVAATNPPSITNQPQNQTVTEGNNVTFTVGTSGTPPLFYQWQWYSTNLPGATTSTLVLNNVTTNQGGPYSVTVTNVAGSTNSQTATLTVNSSNSAPIITTQPQNQSVAQGGTATFTVAAIGAQPLSYQWQFYGTNLDGATNSSLVLGSVTANQGGPYAVTITNSAGATNSQTATLTVSIPPGITSPPQSQTATEGNTVIFTVGATGTSPLSYQWQFFNTNLPGATDSTLTLSSVTTNQAGPYTVLITNTVGTTSSVPATLTVTPLPALVPALSYVTYNMKGNGATNFTTNGPQLQAIGRELQYLNPDVITFNEIQHSSLSDMTNFALTYLPGYNLVISPSSDGFIQNGIASRFPITYFKSFLHSADLSPYGYTNSDFTRDLFQARVSVPGFVRPLNVFVVHLKSGQDTDSSNKRSAETLAVSNWFVTVFLATNSLDPYALSGDMNEDIDNPPASNPQSIQHLINAATGLQLTTPLNPVTHSQLTFSIQSGSGLTKRYDYIMPCALLVSNITSSQVFRTDLLTNPPPPLLTNDDSTASDHLPVQMVFANPYDKAFRLTSITRSNLNVTLKWQSVLGQPYRLETSSNFGSWSVFASNLVATGATYTFSTNVGDSVKFFRVYRVP